MLAVLHQTDTGYRLLLLGHILFIIVGFGSSFVWPFLGMEMSKRGGPVAVAFSEFSLKTSKFVTTYAIYVAGLFGLALAIASERMDESWMGISMAVFVVMVLFAGFVHVPNLKKLDDLGHAAAASGGQGGPPPQAAEMMARGKAAARNGGILHLGFAVVLVLMIWQPGAN